MIAIRGTQLPLQPGGIGLPRPSTIVVPAHGRAAVPFAIDVNKDEHAFTVAKNQIELLAAKISQLH